MVTGGRKIIFSSSLGSQPRIQLNNTRIIYSTTTMRFYVMDVHLVHLDFKHILLETILKHKGAEG